jgi:hypothetical protein
MDDDPAVVERRRRLAWAWSPRGLLAPMLGEPFTPPAEGWPPGLSASSSVQALHRGPSDPDPMNIFPAALLRRQRERRQLPKIVGASYGVDGDALTVVWDRPMDQTRTAVTLLYFRPGEEQVRGFSGAGTWTDDRTFKIVGSETVAEYGDAAARVLWVSGNLRSRDGFAPHPGLTEFCPVTET